MERKSISGMGVTTDCYIPKGGFIAFYHGDFLEKDPKSDDEYVFEIQRRRKLYW